MKWTAEKNKFLLDNIRTMSWVDLAANIGTTVRGIKAHCSLLKIKKSDRADYHTWQPSEVEFLKDNYQTMTYREIGKKLGVSRDTVQSKLIRLGLSDRTDNRRCAKRNNVKYEKKAEIKRPSAEYQNKDVTKLLDYYANIKTA